MAAEQGDQEKTEEPTQQKRDDFRKQGQVVQTKELASAFVLFGSSLGMWFLARFLMGQAFEVYNDLYSTHLLNAIKSGDVMPALGYAFKKIFLIILPILGILFFVSVASTMVQIGVLFTSEPLKPNLNKINPLNGLKRLFSLKAIVEGGKAVLKFSLVGGSIYLLIRGETSILPSLMFSEPIVVLTFIGSMAFKMMLIIGILMLVLAAADYFFQRFDMEKQMRMTKQEVKEENKQREGDPLIKARIRKVQKEMANKRMMEAVPKADVIITNPTHIAIALKYDPQNYASPVILAKGVDHVAQKIRELAKDHNIPIVENKPLARTIYKSLEIGQTIPRELFSAVAEVLAYVFKLKRKKMKRG